MKRYLVLLFCVVTTTSATAQTQTVIEQALFAKLGIEINAGLQCTTGLINAQNKIKELENKIKELETKGTKK